MLKEAHGWECSIVGLCGSFVSGGIFVGVKIEPSWLQDLMAKYQMRETRHRRPGRAIDAETSHYRVGHREVDIGESHWVRDGDVCTQDLLLGEVDGLKPGLINQTVR